MTFPLAAKADVHGENQHPLYAELTKPTEAGLPDRVQWNFEKFLVDRDGKVIARFAPAAEPDSLQVVDAVQAAVA